MNYVFIFTPTFSTTATLPPIPQHENCTVDAFVCHDGTCIPFEAVCDNRADCSRGEDEHDCECARNEVSMNKLFAPALFGKFSDFRYVFYMHFKTYILSFGGDIFLVQMFERWWMCTVGETV